MLGVLLILGTLSAVQALDGLLKRPFYLAAYVTGDTSIKLAWEVRVPSNNTVYELRWKIKSNESSLVVDGTTGTTKIHNLRVYTPYQFRIRRGYGNGTWGSFTKYTLVWTPEGVPTSPPANVTAFNSSSVSIMVHWSQVPKPHRHGYVIGYKVCYEQANKNNSVMYCTTVFALGIELGGLKAYTPYWITVLGFTNKGEGPTSQPLKVWTDEFVPTAAPEVVSLTTNTTAFHVQWRPIPQEHVNGILRGYYVIYWERPRQSPYNRVLQVNQSTLSAHVTGLKRNTSYGMRLTGLTRIRGWLRNGVVGDVHNVTTKHGSAAPQNVKVSSPCSTCLTLTWDPVSSTDTGKSILGYHVTYKEDSEEPNTKELGPSKTTANLVNLTKYSIYTVTVNAITDEGLGETSSPISIRTKEDVPSRAPDSLNVRSTGSGSIKVDWSPVAHKYVHGVLRGYHVYYKSERTKSKRSTNQAGVIKALSVNMSSLGVEITGLEPFTSYVVWVSAFTDVGSGPPSTTVTVTTDEDVPSRGPKLLKAMAKSSSSIFLQWRPISQSHVQGILLGYHVHYKQEGTQYPVIQKVVTVNESVDHVTLDNMQPLTRYSVWITGFTTKGPGPESDHAFVATPQTAPESPQQVHVQILSSQSVRITWRSHTGLTGHVTRYMVKWLHLGNPSDSNVDGHKIVNAGNPYRRETQVGGLKPFNMYSFVVREEIGNENWGKFSEPVDVIMPEDVPTPPRGLSIRSKEGTQLVLQWRRPESTNGVLRKYVLHFQDIHGSSRSFTLISEIDKEYVTYELTLPDIETEYRIKVQAFNSLPGSMSDELAVQHSPSVQTAAAHQSNFFKTKLIWLIAGLVLVVLLLIFVGIFVLVRRESRRSQKQHVHKLSIISTSANPRRPIPVKELADHCAHFHENNHALFMDEFRCLDRLTWKSTWEASQAPVNKSKNRYCNIVAYDRSRVVLTAIKDVPGSDYINANYVDGYSTPAKYIATQGPMKETVNDFWRMVWEKNVRTIVMIDMQGRDCFGNEDPGCEQYWHETEPTEYGNVAVSLLSTTAMSDWKVREFIVWSIDPECMDKREIFQYQFTSWPDHWVPHDTAPLLMFHHKLMVSLGAESGPLLVHCSAGVGRTGTFIAIDSLMEQMVTEGVVDVYGFVAQMRKQRNFMVKTEDQYWFIYEVLRDLSLCGVTMIPSIELGSGLMCCNGDEPEIISRRAAEFESLQVHSPSSPHFSDALIRENVVKNRCPEILPFNHNRVRLKALPHAPGSDYINASLIDGYGEGGLYIATQGPMASTVDDFWRMVWQQRSTVVVMLTELQDSGVEQSVQYWPDEGCTKYGKLRVTKIDEEVLDDHTQRVFKIKCHGSDESLVLYHFQYQSWPENGLTMAQSLLYLHQQVHKIRSGELRQGPIIVHCSNGDARTGVFLSLSHSIDRLEAEDTVDVFQTVRWLRSQRPGLIGNSAQYNFCYETIKSYLAWRIRANRNDYV